MKKNKKKENSSENIRCWGLSVLSAVLLILSFPNFNFSFLIWFGLVPLLFVLDGKRPLAAFGWAYLTGFLFFFGTHYWLIHVTLPGMVLVNMYLALYFGLFGLGYCAFEKVSLKNKLWILPSLWVACELIRDRFLTGFGWACLGHSQYQVLPMIQIADMTGVFGVSFLIVMVNVVLKRVLTLRTLFVLAGAAGEKRTPSASPALYVVVGGVVGLTLIYGYWKLGVVVPAGKEFKIAVIQPNIPQSNKWDPASWPGIQKKILALTEQAGRSRPDLIIWPETSFPGYIWQSPDRFEEIKNSTVRRGIPLLLGAVTKTGEKYYNSAILLSPYGKLAEQYDKMHLVPFGEFLPLRQQLRFLEDIVPIGDFTAGERLTLFPLQSKNNFAQFSVLICFEDTISHVAGALVKQGAGFLVNITNDGWFKDTNAPVLHLQGAVFQAVANRRPMVRAANTGVSCFIDKYGRIHDLVRGPKDKAVMVEGYRAGLIFPAQTLSFYTRFGDLFAYLCFTAVAAGTIKRKYLL